MAFHFFDNVLLLDLTFEAAKGVFKRFALLKLYFCQTKYTSQLDQNSRAWLGSFEEPTIKILNGATLKFPALHTEGTDIIGG
jgi:hypothetical protein